MIALCVPCGLVCALWPRVALCVPRGLVCALCVPCGLFPPKPEPPSKCTFAFLGGGLVARPILPAQTINIYALGGLKPIRI